MEANYSAYKLQQKIPHFSLCHSLDLFLLFPWVLFYLSRIFRSFHLISEIASDHTVIRTQHNSKENGTHTVNECYTEKTFFTTHTFYLADHKKYMNSKLILKAVFWAKSSWNWLVSLDDLPAPQVQLKGHTHMHDATVAWEYLSLLLVDLHSTAHCLGETVPGNE